MSFGKPGSLGAGFGREGARDGGVPSWVPNTIVNAGFDLFTNLKTNQTWVRKGRLVLPATSILNVSRAGTETQVDSNGNWFSFGSNALAWTNLGAAIWEARTNLFLQSQSPVTQSITVASGSIYAVSVVGSGSIVLSGALSGTVTQGSPIIGATTTTSLTLTTSGITGVFVNAQVELGASVSNPIVTTTASVTRPADVVTLNLAAIGSPTFGSAYSLYARGTPQDPTTYAAGQVAISWDDGTFNNRATLRRLNASGATQLVSVTAGVASSVNSGGWGQNTSLKIAGAWAAGGQAMSFNGAATVATSGTIAPVGTTLGIGSNVNGGALWDGNIEEFAVAFNSRVSNANLQAVTT